MPLVSIITPMYYSEKYVKDFLHMMSSQDYKNIEIICIVDGSPDNTYNLLETIAKEDNRIKAVNQEHANAGVARNFGFSISKGDYVMFLDVDDIYKKNYISKMVNLIERTKADIGVCKHITYDYALNVSFSDQGYESGVIRKETMSPEEIDDLFGSITLMGHNKIFSRKLIEDNNLSFSSSTSLNDMVFTAKALLCAKRISFINESLYTYRRCHNEKSITSNRHNNKESMLSIYDELYKWMEDKKINKKYLKTFCKKFRGSFHTNLRFEEDEKFVENVANYLSTKLPWVYMKEKELFKEAGLRSVAAKIKKIINSRKKGSGIQRINKQYDNEIANIEMIKNIINKNNQTNIKIPLIQEIKWVLDDFGFAKAIKRTLLEMKVK